MKKTLLLGAAVALGLSAVAQHTRVANSNNKVLNKSLNRVDAEPVFPNYQGTRAKISTGNHTNAVCTPMWFGSAPNVYTIGGGITTYKQGCLTYNETLNTYAWTHRRSAGWAAVKPMSSGSIQMDWLNVGTMTHDSTILYFDPTSIPAPGRYPTGVIYTPTGTTTVNGSSAVGSGPALIPGSGSFTGAWFNNRLLSGTATDHTVYPTADQNNLVAPNATMGSTMFMNTDMQQVGSRVLVGGELTDNVTTGSSANFNPSYGETIGHCDFSTGTGVWGYDSIVPNFFIDNTASGLGYAAMGDARIAFFGNTGYVVDFGRLATNYNNSADSMLAPIVYKSTDGGVNWTRILDGYDWRCKHPELMKNVGALLTTPTRHFYPNFRHGIDVTVDGNGALHIVCTMANMVSDGEHPDSAAVYSYSTTHDYTNGSRPVIWDLMTNGTDWKTMMVDSIVTWYMGKDANTESGAPFNPISDGSGGLLPYGARLQVTRSTDGMKLFYSWGDTDTNSTGNLFNSSPDIWVKGYDITSNKFTSTINATQIGGCYFHISADKAYFDGTKHHVPVVYTVPRNPDGTNPNLLDGSGVSDHFYVDCASFDPAADYITPAIWNSENTTYCVVGIEKHNSFLNSVNNYPNPFNNTTNIVVNLNEAKAITVNVYDAIGNLVSSKKVNGNVGENTITFDASALSSGVYHYTVTAGYDKVTKKMVVQK